MEVFYRETPNKSSRRGAKPIYLVLHQTVGAFDGAVSWLRNPKAEASAEEVISRDGTRVAVLIKTKEDAYSWSVGNANYLVAASIEGEWYQSGGETFGFLPEFYETLATRLRLRAAQAKLQWGVDIPLRFSTRKGEPGIVTHGQLAEWYGGSDHFTCGTAYDKAQVLAALDPGYVEVATGRGGRKRFAIQKGVNRAIADYVYRLRRLGRKKITITEHDS